MQAQVLWGYSRSQGPGASTQRGQEDRDPGEEAEADRRVGREEEGREQLNYYCCITECFWGRDDVRQAYGCGDYIQYIPLYTALFTHVKTTFWTPRLWPSLKKWIYLSKPDASVSSKQMETSVLESCNKPNLLYMN